MTNTLRPFPTARDRRRLVRRFELTCATPKLLHITYRDIMGMNELHFWGHPHAVRGDILWCSHDPNTLIPIPIDCLVAIEAAPPSQTKEPDHDNKAIPGL